MSTILPHSDLNTLHARLVEEIPPGASVLDVGAGLAKYHPLLIERGCKLTLLDAHKPYLDERRARWPQIEVLCEEAYEGLHKLQDTGRRWDFVLGVDFIEHLARDHAHLVIANMKMAEHAVILFVPEGNHPQDKDFYSMGGDHWQTHRSTWYAEDLEQLGFTVERWVDFHRWAVNDRGNDPGALWAVWRRP